MRPPSSSSLGTIEVKQVKLNTIKSDTQDLEESEMSVELEDSSSIENNTGKAQVKSPFLKQDAKEIQSATINFYGANDGFKMMGGRGRLGTNVQPLNRTL